IRLHAMIRCTHFMTLRSKMALFAAAFLASGLLYAAQKSLKVDVDLVMVNVTVSDSDNRLMQDLKADNFQLFEDKVEQQIRYFSSEAVPVSIGIIFDISRS